MRRLERLYLQAAELLRRNETRGARRCLEAARVELESVAAAEGTHPAGPRRLVERDDRRPAALAAAAARLRALALQIEIELTRLECERRLLREQRRIQRAFDGRTTPGAGAVDLNI